MGWPGACFQSQHATGSPPPSSTRGSNVVHGSKRYGHRGAKLQPSGMLNGFGTVPLITLSRCPRMPFEGIDASSPSV